MAFDFGQLIERGANSGIYTPETVARRRKLAEALLGQSTGVKPIEHWTQGLAQMLQAGIGGYQMRQADEREATERERANKALGDLLSQGENADMGTLMQLSTDPWASDAGVRMAQVLLGENLADRNRAEQWAREDSRLQQQRDWQLADLADQRNFEQPMFDADLAYKNAQTEALQAKPAIPLTDDQREYAQAKEEGFAGNLQDWIAAKPQSGGVTVNTGDNSSAFAKKADEQAATRLDTIIQEGNNASRFLGDVQQLAALGSQISTGQGAAILNQLGPWAEMAGINIDGLDASQAYESIVARMAPQMRPAGSGATSDFDARQFLTSLPALRNTPEGNKLITDTFAAIQQNKMMAAEIASLAMLPPENGGITWQEAERQIRALPNPYELFTRAREANGSLSPPAGGIGGQSTVTPSDIDALLEKYR